MNAKIMNTQIFDLIKYDLKVTNGQFYVYFNLYFLSMFFMNVEKILSSPMMDYEILCILIIHIVTSL